MTSLHDLMITLKNTAPLAKGHNRFVFQHPDRDELLIKVVSAEFIERRFGPKSKWYKRNRRAQHFVSYIRETQEYLVSRAHSGEASEYFQVIEGFAETDLGLGLVVRAVRGSDGNLAPTLASLIIAGKFGSQLKADLETTLDEILKSPIIVSDLNLGNFVHDGSRFVLIDGFGNNNPIPLKILSKGINRRSKLARFKRLRERIERCQREHNLSK